MITTFKVYFLIQQFFDFIIFVVVIYGHSIFLSVGRQLTIIFLLWVNSLLEYKFTILILGWSDQYYSLICNLKTRIYKK